MRRNPIQQTVMGVLALNGIGARKYILEALVGCTEDCLCSPLESSPQSQSVLRPPRLRASQFCVKRKKLRELCRGSLAACDFQYRRESGFRLILAIEEKWGAL